MKKLTARKNVLVILTIILIFSIFLVILLIQKQNQEKTPDFTKNSIDGENIAIYGNPDKTEVKEQQELVEQEKGTNNTSANETAATPNREKINSYSLSEPTIIEKATFYEIPRKIIGINNGFVYVLSGNKIYFYDPERNDTYLLAENVNKVYPTRSKPYILFEQNTGNQYSLNYYNFGNKKGIDELAVLEQSSKNFGIIGDYGYYTIQEQPNVTFYQPLPDADPNAFISGIQTIKGNIHDEFLGELVSFDPSTYKLYITKMGERQRELASLRPIGNYKHIVHFKVNPFRQNRLDYLATFSQIEDDLLGEKTVYNGKEIPELTNILDFEWIDENSIVYTTDSRDGELYFFNFKTKENLVLDTHVAAFGFDSENKVLYYLYAQDGNLRYIEFSKN